MKRLTVNKTASVFFFLLFSTGFSVLQAQKRQVQHLFFSYCGDAKDRNNYLGDVEVAVYLDDKQYNGDVNYYPVGAHTLRVVLKPIPGNEAASSGYTLKKVEWQGADNTDTRKIIQTFYPNKKEFSFSAGVNPPGPYWGYALIVHVDKCSGIATEKKPDTWIHGNNEVRVVGLRPSVQVHKAGTPEDDWRELEMNAVLQEGDEISCDHEGIALLQFADESTTKVSNTTQLKIASYFTEGGVTKTEILLKMGEVAAKVHKSEATKSDFRIKSPTDVSSVRGTLYSHRYDPVTKSSLVKVEEGVVEVKPVNSSLAPVTIKAGQQVEVSNNTVSKISPVNGKIDISIPAKTSTNTTTVSPPAGTNAATWKITEGADTGVLTLYQSGTNLSGSLNWNDQRNGTIESGYLFTETIMFTVVYPGDLRVVYTARVDQSGKKMLNGSTVSNKGTSTNWSATKQ